jgi:hypothetical protein
VNPITRHATTAGHAAVTQAARARHGRPARITIRAVIAVIVVVLAARYVPETPAAPAIQAGAALWWAITLGPDLAPATQPAPAKGMHGREGR